MNSQEYIIANLDELPNLVELLLTYAGERKKFCFKGEIGAGKTTFIQSICKHFNVQQEVVSPTYSIINEYSGQNREQLLYHMDLYRLKSEAEAIDIGIEDYLYSRYYCFIEWYELIENLLPDDVLRIHIELLPDSSRKFIFL